MPSYRVAGLSVASEIALPGLDAGAPAPPDIRIREGEVPLHLADATATSATWAKAGDRFLLRIPGLTRLLLTQGRDLVFAREDGAAYDDMAIFLATTGLGILLQQRGEVVLSASAVAVDGKAVLFCGPSGAGKSTLAAALAERSYPLVADEICVIDSSGGAPIVHSDGGRLRLWAQAIDRLGLYPRRGAALRPQIQKFLVAPACATTDSLPIGALYGLLETRPPLATGIGRPNIVDVALSLRRNAYRPRLIAEFQQRKAYFHAAIEVAKNAGIFSLVRPLDFERIEETVAMLERHWSEIGLLP